MQVLQFLIYFSHLFVRRAVLEVQLLIICPSSYTYTSYNFNIQSSTLINLQYTWVQIMSNYDLYIIPISVCVFKLYNDFT